MPKAPPLKKPKGGYTKGPGSKGRKPITSGGSSDRGYIKKGLVGQKNQKPRNKRRNPKPKVGYR